MNLSSNGKVLAVLLLVFVFCDILLSPLGFETRANAILGNTSSLPWFAGLVVGLVLNIAALILVFFRPRAAGTAAFVGSLIYLIVLLGDQAGLVVSIRPPPLITDVEVVTFFVLIGTLFFAWRVYTAGRSSPAAA
jgi:hypothetical protein